MNEHVRRLLADIASGDPWGEALGVWFGVASVLYASDPNMIPASWRFRQAPGLQSRAVEDFAANEHGEDFEAEQIARAFLADEISEDELVHAGNVLDRYTDVLDAMGLSY